MVTIATPPSNTTTHMIPKPRDVVKMVQTMVRERRATRARYKLGARKRSSTYHLSNKIAFARDTYFQLMQPYVASEQRPHIVYTDESCIHHHYKCRNHTLYDPNDELDLETK
ncbi:hypothetical protein H257_08096 [Aphanomyces astaci]|uniref:Uncharacterized protein n=1 Tax=Aphanomyces astaci TaxID=112090 RepID=W4GG18_APHAT|nr:hypothetical protein H257_08096 [Aphanomyces astaci]ETV78600.1 hypothetical protein H257_08096 [Aphanomyces astaci]|eukprot:XP_009832181.1 hypothetical protein H257_08096 [Aphanomyces astaci]